MAAYLSLIVDGLPLSVASGFDWRYEHITTNQADFVAGTVFSGTVTIPAGQTVGRVDLGIQPDSDVEPDETGRFVLSSPFPSGSTITQTQVTATILNDDTAGGSTPVVPSGWAYADDFESGAASVASRANWVDTAQVFKVRSGQVYADNAGGPDRYATFGPSLSDNFEVEIEYNTTGDNQPTFDPSRQDYGLLYADATHYLSLLASGGNVRGTYIGSSYVQNWVPSTPVTEPSTGKGKLLARVSGGALTLRLNGEWLSHFNNGPGEIVLNTESGMRRLTTLGAPSGASGPFVLHSAGRTYDLMGGVKVRPVKMAIRTLHKFVGQREVGGTVGDCTVQAHFDGTPSRWAYRLTDYYTGALVRDLATIGSATVTAANAATLVVELPVGGPYRIEVGWVDASGVFYSDTSKPVSCGLVIATYGQSNGVGRGQTLPRSLVEPLSKLAASTVSDVYGFDTVKTMFGNGSREYEDPTLQYLGARIISDALGVPVCLIVGGQNGTPLDQLLPGSAAFTNFTARCNGVPGVKAGLIFDHGENDSVPGQTPAKGYQAVFEQDLLPGLRTATKNPNLPIFFALPGREAQANYPSPVASWAAFDDGSEKVKLAALALAANASNNLVISTTKIGIAYRDTAHPSLSEPGFYSLIRRDAYSIAKKLGAAVADGRGPIATSVTRSGAQIDITVDLNGATALSGPTTFDSGQPYGTGYQANTFKGYAVSADGFATLLPVSSLTVVGGKIRLTLASAPSGPVKVRSFRGMSYDDRELIYGTYADGRTPIPVFPIWSPLTSN